MKSKILRCILLLIGLAGVLTTSTYSQQNTPNPDQWITNGWVYAVASTDDVTYVGGRFSDVGKMRGHGVPLDVVNGTVLQPFPIVNGNVYAVAPDGNGGWYIGGVFTKVGNAERNRLAHILPDGTLDPNWNPNVEGSIEIITVSGNTIYVGGRFARVGGQIRWNIAAIDAASGQPTAWTADTNGAVYALSVRGAYVYVGGLFSTVNGQNRNNLVAVDVSTGILSSWNPNPNATVATLAAEENSIYAGGSFTTIGGQNRNLLAALDPVSGAAQSWNPNLSGQLVYNLIVTDTLVYAGGRFVSVGDQNRRNIAAIDKATGAPTPWDPYVNNSVLAMALSGDTLYVGGGFGYIDGENRRFIAAFDTVSGSLKSWNPRAGAHVFAVAVAGNVVYAGGMFTIMGGLDRSNVAAFDNATGQATDWNPGASYDVRVLNITNNTLYVGGGYTMTVNGHTRRNIASFDAATGQLTGWNPDVNGGVFEVTVHGDTVYLGGGFTKIGAEPRTRLAAVNAVTGEATPFNPGANGIVKALTVVDNILYAGGEFTQIGGQDRNFLAAIDRSTGLVTGWNPGPNMKVLALAANELMLYVGGIFATIGGEDRNAHVAFDLSTGEMSGWSPGANSGWVETLTLHGNTLYVGGGFSKIGGHSRVGVAAVDATTGEVLPWNAGLDYRVDSIAVSGSSVYVGGGFIHVGDEPRERFARFDGVISKYIVSGRVTQDNTPIQGVNISFSHDNGAATTNSDGRFSYVVESGTTTTITPSLTGYPQWTPSNRVLTNITSNKPGQDFEGTSAILTLTSPNGSEEWETASVQHVTWDASGISALLTISLWKDGQLLGNIAENIDPDSGSFSWLAGLYSGGMAEPGTGYTIKIEASDPGVSDSSDEAFTISSAPGVTILLLDSNRRGLAGGTVKYYDSGWITAGTTDENGRLAINLSPLESYRFRMTYGGASIDKIQDVSTDSTVIFQTSAVRVQLKDSTGAPLDNGTVKYYAGGWKTIGTTVNGEVSVELLPLSYRFRMTYGGASIDKIQDVSTDAAVVFQTVNVGVQLKTSTGAPLDTGTVKYYAGGWQTIGTTVNGEVTAELLPLSYRFRMAYGGASIDKIQDVSTNAAVVFQTVNVSVQLKTSTGAPLDTGTVSYYAGGWKTIGTTVNGEVTAELLPLSYRFRMAYAGASIDKIQDVSTDALVVFQTGQVVSISNTCTNYYAGGWKDFFSGIELLPVTYRFRFNDGTPDTQYSITAGTVNEIH